MYVASDNFVRMNPCSCQQRPSVQEKSPTGCLLLLLLSPHKQSRAKWSFVVWKCISWPGLLIYLFIFYNKPVSNGCCHTRLSGLSRRKYQSFVDSASGFWSKLIGIFFFPFLCVVHKSSAIFCANSKYSVLYCICSDKSSNTVQSR